jgi:hypothetical protein
VFVFVFVFVFGHVFGHGLGLDPIPAYPDTNFRPPVLAV